MKVVKYGVLVCVVCSVCFLVSACSSSDPTEPELPTPTGTLVEEEKDQAEEPPNDILSTGFCHGNELLCLPEMTPELVDRAGGKVHGGTFSNGTFKPTSSGGISFSLTIDTSQSLYIEFDIKNNIPNWTKGERSGGKVSLAALEESRGDYYFSLQRMYRSYRGGGVFRAILTDREDGRKDGSAFVITTSSLAGHYSMSRWGNETHSFKVSIKGNACQLRIDSYRSRSASAPYSIRGKKRVRFILGNRELSRMGLGEGALTRFIRVKVTN